MLTAFDYRLTGTGWAEMALAGDGQVVVVPVSYSCDPLPDLLNGLMRLLRKESMFERVHFDNETTEADLLLTNIDNCALRVEVIENAYFEIFEPGRDERRPMPVFTTYTDLVTVRELVIVSLQMLLAIMGPAAYFEKWVTAPFPEGELTELAELKMY